MGQRHTFHQFPRISEISRTTVSVYHFERNTFIFHFFIMLKASMNTTHLIHFARIKKHNQNNQLTIFNFQFREQTFFALFYMFNVEFVNTLLILNSFAFKQWCERNGNRSHGHEITWNVHRSSVELQRCHIRSSRSAIHRKIHKNLQRFGWSGE